MSLDGKTVLITGSTDGVGYRVAQRLAVPGTTLLIHGRDRTRADHLLSDLRRAGGKGQFYSADFSSLTEVRALADAIQHDHDRLDLLINNAGIGVTSPGSSRQLSRDGHELRFAVNYLAGFLLTHLLLPLMHKSKPVRIVNVVSIGQQPIEFADIMLAHRYSGARAYCQSKLAQIMLTFDLAKTLAGTGATANAVHPATYMDTAMVRRDGIAPISTVDEGADAILHLAVSSKTEAMNGLYFEGKHVRRANAQAYDEQARERLRAISLELVGL